MAKNTKGEHFFFILYHIFKGCNFFEHLHRFTANNWGKIWRTINLYVWKNRNKFLMYFYYIEKIPTKVWNPSNLYCSTLQNKRYLQLPPSRGKYSLPVSSRSPNLPVNLSNNHLVNFMEFFLIRTQFFIIKLSHTN